MKWVSLEANIAAGKSTLQTALLEKLRDVVCVAEPVEAWQANRVLEHAYAEPHVWNFPAQCHFFTTRIDEFRRCVAANTLERPVFFSERSPFSDSLFWQTQLDLGRVSPLLGSIYSDMWRLWQDLLPVRNPHLFVYVDTPVEECARRMQQRARAEEMDGAVDIAYLSTLHAHHTRVFCEDERGARMPDGTYVPVLRIDGTRAFHASDEVVTSIARDIERALNETI